MQDRNNAESFSGRFLYYFQPALSSYQPPQNSSVSLDRFYLVDPDRRKRASINIFCCIFSWQWGRATSSTSISYGPPPTEFYYNNKQTHDNGKLRDII